MKYIHWSLLILSLSLAGCSVPTVVQREANRSTPAAYQNGGQDSANTAVLPWKIFFTDQYLASLIDAALNNNQELMITLQEIELARNEVRIRKGAILPTVGARAGIEMDKSGRYTSQGAGESGVEIAPGQEITDPLTNFSGGLYARWEADIWRKLRTAKKAAISRYLASVEGRNFLLTNLVSEVANSYYELLALDNQLLIVQQNIQLQKDALDIIKIQKEAARATELAVQKFQAEVLKTQSLEYDIRQQITETENRLNLLLGRYPQPIARETSNFLEMLPAPVRTGIPSQLLANRPDIRQAEHQLTAAKLDVRVARAEFYPSLGITAGLGLAAFNPTYLAKLPESLALTLAGDLAGPLINKNAIKAEFYMANARQVQALYNYERTILNAYLEVSTQMSRISNLQYSYELKSKQVAALTQSINISTDLYKSARADYLEVLMTQRDALEAKLELIETKKEAFNASVQVYRALGGGWQ
jgi:NodT family efflux transporter outer membrane factor (OMF) lipoprotein